MSEMTPTDPEAVEAVIRGLHQFQERGVASADVAHAAYLRWLATQGEGAAPGDRGWLVGVRELHQRRAPGTTCLAALRRGVCGDPHHPIHDSKGCGGVMRVAPVGLARFTDPFEIGSDLAAITHGHPSGHLAAGYLAQLVADVSGGAELRAAAYGGLARLVKEQWHEETTAAAA
jgi:ADP-ribosyl-[dinitrogen reductase] hydrolase